MATFLHMIDNIFSNEILSFAKSWIYLLLMLSRFFIAQNLECHAEISLPEAVAYHIRVLRLSEGELVTLFNGQGGEYQARLCAFGKKSVTAQILKFFPYESELPFKITLAQAVASGNKMDWLIEKAVELGVYAIQPLYTSRCVVKLADKRAEQRVMRWQELVHAACEQCGRNQIPKVLSIQPLSDWLNFSSPKTARGLLLSPRGKSNLNDNLALLNEKEHFSILVGPESGFSDEEEFSAQQNGFLSTHLGNRTLRCETAGLAAVAGISALLLTQSLI